MALPADVLPADVLAKVLALVPADLQMTSALRVANQYAKERVDTRWWTAQVQCMKAFVDGHACVFSDDPLPVEGNEDASIEEQQEAFARNVFNWVRPLLKNQPWRFEAHDDATGEITPRAAHVNLRREMTNLSHSELFWTALLFACISQSSEENPLGPLGSIEFCLHATERIVLQACARLATVPTTHLRRMLFQTYPKGMRRDQKGSPVEKSLDDPQWLSWQTNNFCLLVNIYLAIPPLPIS